MEATMNYLKRRITTYWENALTDYGIKGKFLSARYTTDNSQAWRGNILLVSWREENTDYTMFINNADQFTPEEVFNIWMESDWSIFAD